MLDIIFIRKYGQHHGYKFWEKENFVIRAFFLLGK